MPSPPSRDRALGESLFRLASLVVRQRPRDISLTATSTLGTLERGGPRRLTQLAVSEGIAQPSMTALVAQLERLSLVERREDPADRRVVLVAITAEGSAFLRSIRARTADTLTGLLGALPPEDLATLRSATPALNRLLDLADQPLADGPRRTEVGR